MCMGFDPRVVLHLCMMLSRWVMYTPRISSRISHNNNLVRVGCPPMTNISYMSNIRWPYCQIFHIACPVSIITDFMLTCPCRIRPHILSMAIMIRISLILSTSPSHPYRRLDCQLKWSYGHHLHYSLCTWIWDLHSHNSTHWSNLTHWWLMLWCWFIGLFMMGTPPCSCRRIPDNQSYNPTLFLHTRCYFSVSKLAQKPTSPGLHLGMQSQPGSTRYFRNYSETS